MKKTDFLFLGFVLLLLTAQPVFAGWMAIADFTACPRRYIPNTSGQEGPFGTEAECKARVESAKRQSNLTCATYSCKESGGASSTAPATPGHQMDKHIGDAISAGMSGQISGGDAAGLVGLGLLGNAMLGASAPLSPEEQASQLEAQRQREARALQEAEQARLAEVAYQNKQDENSLKFLDTVASAIMTPTSAKPESQNFRGKILCKGGEPGLHTCYVMVCGGAYGGDPICCPEGFPKLNECDCNCYPSNADFECKRYAACQHSYKAPELKGGAN